MSSPVSAARAGVLAWLALASGLGACSSDHLGPSTVAISVVGTGTVTSTPPGIKCPGGSCRHDFTTAELAAGVSLSAGAGANFRFDRWQFTGRLPTFVSDTDPTVVLRDTDAPPVGYTVVATFEPAGAEDASVSDGAAQADSALAPDASPVDAQSVDGGADGGPDSGT